MHLWNLFGSSMDISADIFQSTSLYPGYVVTMFDMCQCGIYRGMGCNSIDKKDTDIE